MVRTSGPSLRGGLGLDRTSIRGARRGWVGKTGLEPVRLAAHDPKSCSAANYDTSPGHKPHASPVLYRNPPPDATGNASVRGRGGTELRSRRQGTFATYADNDYGIIRAQLIQPKPGP